MKSLIESVRGNEKVNIMVGRFQPITNGHLKCINEIRKKTGRPVILCMINTPANKLDEKHPFPSDFLIDYYKDLPVKEVVLVKNADIVKISQELKGYQISGWVCGSDRIDSYRKMASKYAKEANLADDFEMIEIPRTEDDESASKLRNMILYNDYKGFLKMSPIKTYYAKLRTYMLALIH